VLKQLFAVAQELEDLILNGETEIDDDLRNADYQIDIINVEDE